MASPTPSQPWSTSEGTDSGKSDKEQVDEAKLHRENVSRPKHSQTASYDKDTAIGSGNVPGTSGSRMETVARRDSKMEPAKIASMLQTVENTLSPESRQRVLHLLDAVEALNGAEKLLLYLRLPTGIPPHDPLKQPVNPLGSRAELQQTVTWIQTHLEVDPDVSLPKQDVYDEYIAHCMSSNMKPLSTADFGKVMKQVYPSVRPRRLGTRGNSRYCYAGLRKKIKLEVPQLPDLGESSKDPTQIINREAEKVVCEWAETKLGLKFSGVTELSRHLMSTAAVRSAAAASRPGPLTTPLPPATPPHAAPHLHTQGPVVEQPGQNIIKQLKRKLQTQGTPGRPKKNKSQEVRIPEPSTSTSTYMGYGVGVGGGVKLESEPPPLEMKEPYVAGYGYGVYEPPRPGPYAYRPEYYERGGYVRDLSATGPEPPHQPMNLSSDGREGGASWRRRPPDPRLPPLPGKKMILEAYQSETRSPPAPAPPAQYLPKKMRAAEIMGGKAARDLPSTSTSCPGSEVSARSEDTFLEDPKNVTSRSTSTAAALAREHQEAAGEGAATCCGLDGINVRTGVICEERHAEILNRERVISICNIDKHDLDDYLNETNSQEHEEELQHYFQRGDTTTHQPAFLDPQPDPHDDHSQGNNDKISQLRELLAKNLKNQSGSTFQNLPVTQNGDAAARECTENRAKVNEGAFKPVTVSAVPDIVNGPSLVNVDTNSNNTAFMNCNNTVPYLNDSSAKVATPQKDELPTFNGNCHTVPQSPTTRTQQYDFVPISDRCSSPPMNFGLRGASPNKVNKCMPMGGSLQTSPISHSTAASPFVSPRNTPVPRSRLYSRPLPHKHKGRKLKSQLSLGVGDMKHFAMPNDSNKFMVKSPVCGPLRYCQPMSAPPSPNIITSQYKSPMFCNRVVNGNGYVPMNFFTQCPVEGMNGEVSAPLSADPLSSEVSQFFAESGGVARYNKEVFRSQSAPLKPPLPGSRAATVPPTPVPREFCDFGPLADACLNPETLDRIYDAIDSSDVLTGHDHDGTNGCDHLADNMLTTDQLQTLIPDDGDLLDRDSEFNQTFNDTTTANDNDVEDFLKRTNSLEFDLNDFDKNKFYMSRSVPSTPLPYKRVPAVLQIDPRRTRDVFVGDDGYTNGISSKSVPSTPQLPEDRSMFSYNNRDLLINGNSVESCAPSQLTLVDGSTALSPPLHEILREDMLDPLTPTTDLLADLDKIEPTSYSDL